MNIGNNFADKILLIVAYKDNVMIAAAINFISSTHLYGRLVGLHFMIYHIFILNYVIIKQLNMQLQIILKMLRQGAQGEHKLQRGYMPENTWSLHWIKDQEFSKAINQYLDQEIKLMHKQKLDLEQFTPFKNLN